MPAEQKNSYRFLIPAAVLVFVFVPLTTLLLIYIQHVRQQFSAFSVEWVFYTFVQFLNDIRNGRVYEAALTYGVFVVAYVLARRIVDGLGIGNALSRFLAFASVFVLALLLPFHLLAFISLYGDLACLQPYNLLLILLAALIVAKIVVPRPSAPVPIEKREVSMMGLIFGGAGVIAFVAMALVMVGVTQQAYRGYDALWYHLPTALMWRDWRLSANFAPHYAYHYPSNAEAMMYFLACARMFAVLKMFQVLAAMLGSLAIVRICRLLRFENWAGWLAGSAFFLLPVTLNQVVIIGNDVFLAALLLLTVCFLMEAQMGEPHRARLWMALAALVYGAAIGTKYNALFFAPVFAAWFAWIIARGVNEGRRARAIAQLGAVLVLLALLPSAFWFCRNATLHENPLYPFQVSALGHVIFKGQPAQAFRTDKEAEFVKQPRDWFYYPFVERFRWSQSWGGTLAAFMYVIPLVPLVLALRNRRRNSRLAVAHGFCFVIIMFGWLTWAALTAREPRYNLFVFGIMLASGAGLMSVGPPVYRRAMGVLFFATLLTNFYFTTELISERYWLKTEQTGLEMALPGFEEAINAAPTGTVLAKPYGCSSLMLYGDQMRHRVQHTFRVTTETLATLRPELVAEFVRLGQPYQSAVIGNPDYKLVREAKHDIRDYFLYQRVTPAEPVRGYFAANRPAGVVASSSGPAKNPWNVLDGNLNTGWSAGGEANAWVELDWAAPIKAGWLEVSWFKLEYEKYRIQARRDGKWRTVARVTRTAKSNTKPPLVDKIHLGGRRFDALRIEAQPSKSVVGKPAGKKIFNLVEVAGYPPLSGGEIALALAMVIGVALSPFEFRSARKSS